MTVGSVKPARRVAPAYVIEYCGRSDPWICDGEGRMDVCNIGHRAARAQALIRARMTKTFEYLQRPAPTRPKGPVGKKAAWTGAKTLLLR